jgi:opacity protein-like surface antigen
MKLIYGKHLTVLAASALLFSMSAQAEEGVYIGSGGANLIGGGPADPIGANLNLRQRSTVGAFGSLGYRWADGLSAEVEDGVRTRQTDGGASFDTVRRAAEQTTSFMMNARIEPEIRGVVKPYAGVGAGLAITRRNDHSLRERTGNVAPAGQAMAGFAMGLSSRTAVFAEYRYFKAFDQSEAASSGGGKTGSHAGLLGLRVRLGGPIQ